MSRKPNHVCPICGTQYYACDSCEAHKNITPWKVITDTAEHYKILKILSAFNGNKLSDKEAKEMLQNVDLSDKYTFVDEVKVSIDSIMNRKEITRNRKGKVSAKKADK